MRSKSEIFLRKNKICLRQLPGTCLKRSGSVCLPVLTCFSRKRNLRCLRFRLRIQYFKKKIAVLQYFIAFYP